jgi:hypothetical protein
MPLQNIVRVTFGPGSVSHQQNARDEQRQLQAGAAPPDGLRLSGRLVRYGRHCSTKRKSYEVEVVIT